jgi:hypothetical protein
VYRRFVGRRFVEENLFRGEVLYVRHKYIEYSQKTLYFSEKSINLPVKKNITVD